MPARQLGEAARRRRQFGDGGAGLLPRALIALGIVPRAANRICDAS
jgi:hypothetical protein